MCDGSATAQKHATSALWGLTNEHAYRAAVAEADGAVERLVHLLKDFEGKGETQGNAAAILVNLVQSGAGKAAIESVGGAGPLMNIALGPVSWLRTQAVTVLESARLPRSGVTSGLARARSPVCAPK